MSFFSKITRGLQKAIKRDIRVVAAPFRAVKGADPLYRKITTGKWGSNKQRFNAAVHSFYTADPIASRVGISETQAQKVAKAAAIAAAVYFTGGALSSYYSTASASELAAASDAGTLYGSGAAAGGYGGAVFPTTASAALETVGTGATGTSLLSTLGSTVKGIAGTISAAKIIVDTLGNRKVLPEGASVPDGYRVVGNYDPATGLNPAIDSVSSDGVGFKLPSNTGLLFLAGLAAILLKG